jgi:hypothetical protein
VTPIAHFDAAWVRCSQLFALHAYLANNVSAVLDPDELLRAEWVARVSALDLYIHELVAQQMLAIFEKRRAPCPAYLRFQVSNEAVDRIRTAATPSDASAAFDLDIRTQLSSFTFQDPEKIADGVRLCSGVELWNEVALKLGASQAEKVTKAKTLKKDLSLIIQRRNRIAHEGDLQPSPPRVPWPIKKADLAFVANQIETIVRAIDAIV